MRTVSFADKSDDDSGSDDSDSNEQEQQSWLAELQWRKLHPERLHEELWFNLPQEVFIIHFSSLSSSVMKLTFAT